MKAKYSYPKLLFTEEKRANQKFIKYKLSEYHDKVESELQNSLATAKYFIELKNSTYFAEAAMKRRSGCCEVESTNCNNTIRNDSY